MSRPKIFDYDAASEEEIVTAGVEGHKITWIGIRPDAISPELPPLIHMLFEQGTLNIAGDDIEKRTKPVVQVNLESQDFNDFYLANKAIMDALHRACLEYIAEKFGKTGQVIEN